MHKTLTSPVYFDNAATTPPLSCVVDELNRLNTEVIGNPSSTHAIGLQASEVLEQAQNEFARYFNVPTQHVIFTSGGTESNNLAVWGSLGGLTQVFNWVKGGGQGKIITTTIEHSSTQKVFESLEDIGAPISWIGVDKEGFVDLTQLEDELSSRVRLLSLHHAQNEVGTLQDIKTISKLVHSKQPDALIHIDAVQSFMKVPLNLEELGADLVSVSAHKVGGPKGIGALILGKRFETRHPKIGCFISGSSQQQGIRPGTVPVPLIGSFRSALNWGSKHIESHRKHLSKLREHLTKSLPSEAIINGPSHTSASYEFRSPQTLNFSIPGLPSSVAVEALSARGYCVSAGSACHSTTPKPSEVLMQMNVGRDRAMSAIRVSLGHQNTENEINRFSDELRDVIKKFIL